MGPAKPFETAAVIKGFTNVALKRCKDYYLEKVTRNRSRAAERERDEGRETRGERRGERDEGRASCRAQRSLSGEQPSRKCCILGANK